MARHMSELIPWHRRFLPSGIKKDIAIKTGAVLVGIIIVVQLLYPYGRGLPFAKIAGTSVHMATHVRMAEVVAEKFAATKVKLVLDSITSVEFELKQAGAEPNTERMIAALSDYPLWQRLIPGSIVFRSNQVIAADVYYTNAPFREFIEAKSKELTFAPQNARLAIKDGRLVASEALEGSEVETAALLEVVGKASLLLGGTTEIIVPAKRIPAQTYSKDLADVQYAAEMALDHTVTITAEGKQFSPQKEEIATWIVLTQDEKGATSLLVDKEKVKAYLSQLNSQVGIEPGQTDITIVDGREVGRSTGSVGRALEVDNLAEQIATALLVPPSSISVRAQMKEVLPSVIYNSKYTTTQAGLQAYVNDLVRSKNIRISIQQLDGGKWYAGGRQDESTVSGSTYKLYVALVLFDKIDKGEIHWDDPMFDTTVAGCFERMTVASTNPCAESWLAQWGRQYVNDFIYARGFSTGTTFTSNIATHTTASDLSKFMTGLNDGTLVSGANRERLFSSLGRHPYRYGIPTGSKGTVHDKVGFIWDYVNDTAIVNHPRGNYIMTIMTKGYSYATIASITREVERIMYP